MPWPAVHAACFLPSSPETQEQPSLCCYHLAWNQEGFPLWIKAAPQQLLCRIVLNSAKKTFWGVFFFGTYIHFEAMLRELRLFCVFAPFG